MHGTSGMKLHAVSLMIAATSVWWASAHHPAYESVTQVERQATSMLQGLRTVVYHVSDLEQAKEWYSSVVGKAPYFAEPFYVGFDVGGYELGLLPAGMSDPKGGPSVVAYWGVEDIAGEYKRLLELGATERDAIEDVGEGIRVAVVDDPFGNPFGIIYNPHFKAEGQPPG